MDALARAIALRRHCGHATKHTPTTPIIRVEIEEIANRGVYRWCIAGLAVEGQPLLDACRAIKRMGGDPLSRAGLFRAGRTEPDITCTVEAGAHGYVTEIGECSRLVISPFHLPPEQA